MIRIDSTKKINIVRVENGKMKTMEDTVIYEYPFTIFVNGEQLITLLCSPNGLEYLALGFLISEGTIKHKEEIESIKVDEEKGQAYIQLKENMNFSKKETSKRTVTTGGMKGTIFYNVLDSLEANKIINNITVESDKILKLASKLSTQSAIFKETGGVHSCALCDSNGILFFHEDAGRHNALDKIIGEAFSKDIDTRDKILVTSGRISSEMIIKTTRIGIPIVVSIAAPTNLSVQVARNAGITLIGFARENRMNIYSGEERITIN